MIGPIPPAGDSSVLLVRHGPGRGRLQNYGDGWLKRLARIRPDLRRRVRIHETGSGLAPSLVGVAAVLFLLADPVRELYPACYTESAEIAQRAGKRGIRLVNPPDALSNTIKSVQARLWTEAGIPCAPCVRFESRAELERVASSATYPVIVRGDLLHGQQATFVCRGPEEVRALPAGGLAYPGLVVDFLDSRATYRSRAPDGVFARYYHRCRTYVFGRRVVPGGIYFSKDPIVGTGTATWARYQGGGRLLEPLARLRSEDRAVVAADVAFATSPPLQPELARRAARTLGLEFAALDHIVQADGSLTFFEANPHPYIASFRHTPLPFLRHIRPRTHLIYDEIGGLLEDLLAPPARQAIRPAQDAGAQRTLPLRT